MKCLCTIFLVALSLAGFAQQYDPSKVNRKAMRLYQEAMEAGTQGDFKQGIRLLNDALKADNRFMDAWLSIAGMYGEMKQYDAAISNYEKARLIDSVYFRDYNLPYSINLAGMGQFEKALRAVEAFLIIPNLNERSLKAAVYRKNCYEFAIRYQKDNPSTTYKFDPKNLGDSINSAVSEYYPSLTIDGRQLVFTRRVRNVNEDFYQSVHHDTAWSVAQPLPGSINTNYNEGAQTISQDGQMLVFTGCNFPDGFGSCDLYISYLTPDGWSRPENLGSNINTASWESAPSLSPDKRDLYFASKRPGGYGGSDIFISHRMPDGRWTKAENLGPQVNTAGDESCPFIHADNRTLYFTSNGHQGYGGDDLFMIQKEPGGKWGAVKNLGYPVNTIENEGSLVISADGSTAYYASDRSDSRGGLDLYTFELRNDIRPTRTLWIKGKVYDEKTKRGLPSAVELADIDTKELISKVQTDETGNYLITLPLGRDYAFNVNRKGYLFYSGSFPLSQKAPDSTYNIDIPLQPLEANATIILKNIFFDVNKYDIKSNSEVELNMVVNLLRDNPTLRIQISGHTDNVGRAEDNLTLSNNRAKAVVDYLTSGGINRSRLVYQGYGAKLPVADNSTEEGRAQNRRTELKVIGK